MFSDLAWGLLILILILVIWQFVVAIREDLEEHAKLENLAKSNFVAGDPKKNPDQWNNAFQRVYGRKPEDRKSTRLNSSH